MEKAVFKNLAKFTGKHLCQNHFLNKATGLRPVTLLKKRLWHKCYPVNLVNFLRNHSNRTSPTDYFLIKLLAFNF